MLDEKLVQAQPSKTLARGLQVLEAFNSSQASWGIRELSRELNMTPATVHRIVTTLCNIGYLEQGEESERYSLGPQVMRLAEVYTHHNPLATVGKKVFSRYADRFRYNFYLGKLFKAEVVYLAAYDGHGPIKIVVEPGGTATLHTTALGKVLLAFQSEAYIDRFLQERPLVSYTPNSVVDPDALREELAQIRAQRYAVNRGEHYQDVGAIGVPLFVPGSDVEIGMSLAYPQHLMLEGRVQVGELVDMANEIAAEIVSRMGYTDRHLGRRES